MKQSNIKPILIVISWAFSRALCKSAVIKKSSYKEWEETYTAYALLKVLPQQNEKIKLQLMKIRLDEEEWWQPLQ